MGITEFSGLCGEGAYARKTTRRSMAVSGPRSLTVQSGGSCTCLGIQNGRLFQIALISGLRFVLQSSRMLIHLKAVARNSSGTDGQGLHNDQG